MLKGKKKKYIKVTDVKHFCDVDRGALEHAGGFLEYPWTDVSDSGSVHRRERAMARALGSTQHRVLLHSSHGCKLMTCSELPTHRSFTSQACVPGAEPLLCCHLPFGVTLITSSWPPISTNIRALSAPQTQLKPANMFKGYTIRTLQKDKA